MRSVLARGGEADQDGGSSTALDSGHRGRRAGQRQRREGAPTKPATDRRGLLTTPVALAEPHAEGKAKTSLPKIGKKRSRASGANVNEVALDVGDQKAWIDDEEGLGADAPERPLEVVRRPGEDLYGEEGQGKGDHRQIDDGLGHVILKIDPLCQWHQADEEGNTAVEVDRGLRKDAMHLEGRCHGSHERKGGERCIGVVGQEIDYNEDGG